MIRIEKALVSDAMCLSEIYAPYVRETAITFEYEPPSAEEFAERMRTIIEGYPYLKAVDEDGSVIGYAYASAFKKRAAYDRSVEVSIYVRRDSRRSGAGRLLYNALESSLRDMGIINLCACITVPSEDSPEDKDGRVTDDSFRFHERMGYSLAGRLHRIGYKFGEWYDVVWMEKTLGEHKAAPDEIRIGDWRLI